MFGNINLITIFTTGLLTGGLSCMAVQGGLLTAALAQQEEEKLKENLKDTGNALPILSFLAAKLIAYTLLGIFLGFLGSFFKLSLTTQVILQVAVGIFMIGTALNLLDVHPVFRYFVIQPPKFFTRLIRKQSKRKASTQIGRQVFAPSLLGAFTIFIPCGTTQAMMALAVGSGKPLLGAAVLFAFVLGTSPVFFVLGYMTMKLGDLLKSRFMKVAAAAIILLAVLNFDSALALTGSNWTLGRFINEAYCVFSYCPGDLDVKGAADEVVNEATINIGPDGYTPNLLTVKTGSNVTLHLTNKGGSGCVQAFTIPSLNVQKIVPVDSSGTLQFKAPDKPTEISFMCSMGMYRGTIKVI